MTIRKREPGKWRRVLAALAASGALIAGGLAAVGPVQAEPVTFVVEATNGKGGKGKCETNTVIEGSRPGGYVHGTASHDGGLRLTCNGTVVQCGEGEELNDAGDGCVSKPEPPASSDRYETIPDPGTPPDLDTKNPPGAAVWTGDRKAIAPLSTRAQGEVNCTMLGTWEKVGDVKDVPGGIWCAEWKSTEPDQEFTPPPPCWDADINNCPVGGALVFEAPEYAIVGVPVTMYAYASWKPDANSPAQPTDGSAVIRVDGEDYSGVPFNDGVAQWRFIPKTPGVKEFTASGVLFSGLSGANAYIDTVPASVTVLPYDPAAFAEAFAKKRVEVEVDSPYTIVDRAQAAGALAKRLEWRVASSSDDVCAVYETKRGAVRLKFTDTGKCKVIWEDPKTGDEGKYTFIAKK